ncbi:DUF5615 family PIN-like protein [Roseofilum sp. BLCC_M91]|uniref:DUF5615 family PIN-like protein n=1 Tax=Roseofilum halophilum BLCC-M91 TaxID=3022259 RepID=A0ABT7BKY3_9CYAN|nr:DUF5615 family PIN-like protein [Roseofilum halophilum BLCC-M91]
MKLLFDENLSPKLPNRLSDIFPNSLHVRDSRGNCCIPKSCRLISSPVSASGHENELS